MFYKYFHILACGLSFHFLNGVFGRAKVSNFDEIQFLNTFMLFLNPI